MSKDAQERGERRSDPVSREETRIIVAEAVRQTLIQLGLDITEPLEIQKDMLHLRQWRQTTETVKRNGFLTLVGTVIAGALGLLWTAIKSAH